MLSRVISGAVLGVDAYRVDVEVDVARSLPSFTVVGLPDNAVRESKERVRAAVKNAGYSFPPHRITVNLAPADVKKEGAAFDLPMALAVLCADPDLGLEGLIEAGGLEGLMVLGELSLDGRIRPVKGVLPIACEAKRLGATALLVPRENAAEAAVVRGLDVYAADTLGQVVEGLRGGTLERVRVDVDALLAAAPACDEDFRDVHGQAHVKRALEVAAAGGHNVLILKRDSPFRFI